MAGLLVILYAASLLLWDLHAGRALTLHEVFAAQPAREMVQGRHWIVPKFLGVPRTNKPPTMSWLIAASMKLLGGESEVAARLPAALSGVLTAWLIALLAGRWYGSRIGLLTGLFQATTVYTLTQARLAEADMPMCAAVTAAFVTFAVTVLPRSRFGGEFPTLSPGAFLLRAVLFHAFVGIAFLLKGPVGPLFVFMACLPCAVVAWRRWQQRAPLWLLLHPAGLVVLAAFVTVWPVSAYLAYPPILASWKSQTLGRVAGDLGGREPFLFYAYTLPWMVLPAFLFLPCALRRIRVQRCLLRPVTLFLLLWVAGGFVLLQATAFKHKHYMIPLLPPISIAAAIGVSKWMTWRRRGRGGNRPRTLLGPVLAGVLGAASVMGAQWFVPQDLRLAAQVMALLFFLLLGAALWLEARGKMRAPLACFFAAVWIVDVISVSVFVPRFDTYSIQSEFASQALQRLASTEPAAADRLPLHLYALGESQIAFYLPLDTRRVDKPASLLDALQGRTEKNPIYFITQAKAVAALTAGTNLVRVEELDRAEPRRKGKDQSRLVLVKAWLESAKP